MSIASSALFHAPFMSVYVESAGFIYLFVYFFICLLNTSFIIFSLLVMWFIEIPTPFLFFFGGNVRVLAGIFAAVLMVGIQVTPVFDKSNVATFKIVIHLYLADQQLWLF
jgi:hypothetical protein